MNSRAPKTSSPSAAPCGGRRRAPCPGRAAAAAGVGGPALFFDNEAQAGPTWNMSPNALGEARRRHDPALDGAFVTIGSRVLYSRLVPRLRALGIKTPAELGAFCAGAGIRDLAGLVKFFGLDEGGAQ
jgi:hypothetical protein